MVYNTLWTIANAEIRISTSEKNENTVELTCKGHEAMRTSARF